MAEALTCKEKDGHTCEGGKQSVEREQDESRCFRVYPKKPECACNNIGIDWRHPGCRTSIRKQGIAETVTFRDGARNTSGLVAEFPVIAGRIELLVDEKEHDDEPDT